MAANELGSEWQVAWATPRPHEGGYLDNLVLNREQAIEYGDELVQSIRIDGGILADVVHMYGIIYPKYLS
jgi:hypothetical protein